MKGIPILYWSRIARHSARRSAVLPDPTGLYDQYQHPSTCEETPAPNCAWVACFKRDLRGSKMWELADMD